MTLWRQLPRNYQIAVAYALFAVAFLAWSAVFISLGHH